MGMVGALRQKMSLHIPWQSDSSRPFCPIELRGAFFFFFKGDTPKTVPPENEMLRSLTFIRQIGYGFKAGTLRLALG